MHIQEGTNTTLTTCTKMTEEVDRRHGVNGTSSSKGVNEDPPVHSASPSTTGGRLKFFKDGKFILELVRGCAREGERSGWVSVPRKTFWPPAAAPPTPPHAHPPSASLSLSDDNSSLHSSPCTSHRDHCWKQPTPRRHISKELAMYYCRPATLHNEHIHAAGRVKRRRPHDTSCDDALPNGTVRRTFANGLCEQKRNGDARSPAGGSCRDEDAVDGPVDTKTRGEDDRWADFDREKYHHMKLKRPYQYHKLRVYKKTRPRIRRKELARTIERLREKVAALPVLVNAKLANCRQEHAIVSPRKRILREMERVNLAAEDQATKRRAKTAPALSTASYPPSPGPSHTPHRPPADPAARPPNGAAPRREQQVTKNVSSYSIHSLLSMPDESPTRRSPEAKRSPHSYPPSLKTESPSSVHSPDPSPSPDGFRYRYSALTLGSPGRGAARDSPTPPHAGAPQAFRAYAPPTSPYARWAAASGYGAPAPAPAHYVLGYPYAVPAPVYRAPAAAPAPAPLWLQYAPPPWPHPLLAEHVPKDEPASDLPLNLSKH